MVSAIIIIITDMFWILIKLSTPKIYLGWVQKTTVKQHNTLKRRFEQDKHLEKKAHCPNNKLNSHTATPWSLSKISLKLKNSHLCQKKKVETWIWGWPVVHPMYHVHIYVESSYSKPPLAIMQLPHSNIIHQHLKYWKSSGPQLLAGSAWLRPLCLCASGHSENSLV